MTTPGYSAMLLPRRTSATAILGFIFGLLLCVPLLSGILGIIFSVLGIRATRDPQVTGRGLAIAGLTLGIINFCVWTCIGGFFGVVIFSAAAPRATMQDFGAKLGAGNTAGAAALCDSTMTADDLEKIQRDFTARGTYEGLTSWGASITRIGGISSCRFAGTIRFSGTARPFEAELSNNGSGWKIERFAIR